MLYSDILSANQIPVFTGPVNLITKILQSLRLCCSRKKTISPPQRVTGNFKEEGGGSYRPKFLKESGSLSWNFQRGRGSNQKDPLWGEYGYFL